MNGTPFVMFDTMPICLEPCIEEWGIFHEYLVVMDPSIAVNDARSYVPFSAEVFA